MKILGISPLDKDATVSLIVDGKIVFAAGEERFSRVKQQSGFPALAIQEALKCSGLIISDIDVVAYPFLTAEREKGAISRNLVEEKSGLKAIDQSKSLKNAFAYKPKRNGAVPGLDHAEETLNKSILHKLAYRLLGNMHSLSSMTAKSSSEKWAEKSVEHFENTDNELISGLRASGFLGEVRRFDHHLTHAANAHFASGFEKTLCITLDGYGTGLAGSVSVAEGLSIKRIAKVSYPNSLGTFYEHVTSSLGFKPGRHEGKIVGLAAYGDPHRLAPVLRERVTVKDGVIHIHQANNIFFSRYLATHFPKIDVAAAYQYVLEEVAKEFVAYWVKKTGVKSVVLSGGVTANVKLNQRIFSLPDVERIFVYPNMGDGGCGTGAAMLVSAEKGIKPIFESAYLGPVDQDSDLLAALKNDNLTYVKPENLAKDVAALLHDGKVVARYDGRMEYGPRALGNRTIMYHGRDPGVNQWLNTRLGRTEFMPFAPVTLFESREDCYYGTAGAEYTAEFMTVTFDCTDFMKKHCPAAVHVDGTARPQLIRRDVNPGYYDIIKEYEALSGSPSVINTSFNMHEEPIVCSPKDAVRAFLLGELDYLVLGPYLVKHPCK